MPGVDGQIHAWAAGARRLWRAVAALALITCTNVLFAAQFPEKPVRLVTPYPPGGGTDAVARPVAASFAKAWGQSVVIDNRVGAGGNIGGEAAAHSPADGYTLFMTSGSIVTANPYMYKSMSFDPAKDFVAITTRPRARRL